MQIDEYTFNIETYQGDWGIPVPFTAKTEKGFAIGDEIRLIIDLGGGRYITDSWTVDNPVTDFSFKLTEQQASDLFSGDIKNRVSFPYSIKRYRDGEYLDTIKDATFIVRGTVEWQN